MKKKLGNLEDEEGEECTSLDICMFEVEDDPYGMPNPFPKEKRPLVMANPFKGQQPFLGKGNPFTQRSSVAVGSSPLLFGGVNSGGHGGEDKVLFADERPTQRHQPVFNRWNGGSTSRTCLTLTESHHHIHLMPPRDCCINTTSLTTKTLGGHVQLNYSLQRLLGL